MGFDAPFEDDDRVLFAGDQGGIALVFDSETLPTGSNGEEFSFATVAIRVPGIQAIAKVSFFASSLDAFLVDLERAQRALRGTAELRSEDDDFTLRVAYGERGHVRLTGHLQPHRFQGSMLHYEIDTDQSYLQAILLALGQRLRARRMG